MKIMRKPKDVRCMVKDTADSIINIMLRLDINEGKHEMLKKKWRRNLELLIPLQFYT